MRRTWINVVVRDAARWVFPAPAARGTSTEQAAVWSVSACPEARLMKAKLVQRSLSSCARVVSRVAHWTALRAVAAETMETP